MRKRIEISVFSNEETSILGNPCASSLFLSLSFSPCLWSRDDHQDNGLCPTSCPWTFKGWQVWQGVQRIQRTYRTRGYPKSVWSAGLNSVEWHPAVESRRGSQCVMFVLISKSTPWVWDDDETVYHLVTRSLRVLPPFLSSPGCTLVYPVSFKVGADGCWDTERWGGSTTDRWKIHKRPWRGETDSFSSRLILIPILHLPQILEQIDEWEDPKFELYHVTDRYGFIQ